jgi:hypothetical protein
VLAKATPIFRHALISVEEACKIFNDQIDPEHVKVEKRIYFEKAGESPLKARKKGKK